MMIGSAGAHFHKQLPAACKELLALPAIIEYLSQYFLFYISKLSLHLLLDSPRELFRDLACQKYPQNTMDLMLETCYMLCSFEALFFPAVFGWVLDLSATTRKI